MTFNVSRSVFVYNSFCFVCEFTMYGTFEAVSNGPKNNALLEYIQIISF